MNSDFLLLLIVVLVLIFFFGGCKTPFEGLGKVLPKSLLPHW